METATIPNEDFHSPTNEGNSDPASYGRGYRPLVQEDPEISFTHGERNTAPQQPTMTENLPPYPPEPQTSQYTPAPQRFNPQHQSSSVSTKIWVGTDSFLLQNNPMMKKDIMHAAKFIYHWKSKAVYMTIM